MPCPFDNAIGDKGPDSVHIAGMGKAYYHVLPGKIGGQRFKPPSHEKKEEPSYQAEYFLHIRSFPKKVGGV